MVGANAGGGLRISATPNTRYTLSAYGKVTGTQWGAIGYTFYNSAGAKIGSDVYAGVFGKTYGNKSLTFTAPVNAVWIEVLVWNNTGGVLYLDEVSLVR
jgi:hypothetical protein